MLYNRERMNDYLAKYDLEAIVASTNIGVSYLTGLDCWFYRDFRENMLSPGASNSMIQSYAVVTPDRPPTVILGQGVVNFVDDPEVQIRSYGGRGTDLGSAKRGAKGEPAMWSNFRKALASTSDTPGEALVLALKEHGVKKGRVGVEFSNMSKASRKHLAREMDRLKLLETSELVRLVRMVKTEGEHQRMKRTAEVTERAMNKSLEEARGGAAFGKLIGAYKAEVARQGAAWDHYTFSPAGFGISEFEGQVFRAGDATQIDCGAVYKLYASDTGVSVVFGDARKDAEKTYRVMWELFDSCVDSLVPGATPSKIMKRANKAYKKAGMQAVSYQGHGIGLEAREHPIIVDGKRRPIRDDVVDLDTDIPLEEGMVINIETGLNLYGNSSYQVERTFRIGKRKPIEITPKRSGQTFVAPG